MQWCGFQAAVQVSGVQLLDISLAFKQRSLSVVIARQLHQALADIHMGLKNLPALTVKLHLALQVTDRQAPLVPGAWHGVIKQHGQLPLSIF